MAQDVKAADALTRHVFGPDDPSVSLLDNGRFPPGWVEEYRHLIETVAEEWAAAPAWPRHMVGALHYTLTHLRVRYSAWQSFGDGRRDQDTERELSRVEALTRILFARAFPPQESKQAERIESVVWPEQTLTQLEGDDWGEPTYPSHVVTNSHRLRHKPLREFTVEDLRFMLGQQISLPILMPLALDVLELVNPFAGGDMNHGTLLYNALKVGRQFWQKHPQLWYQMNVVLVDLHSFREFIERDLLPAAEEFKAAVPGSPAESE